MFGEHYKGSGASLTRSLLEKYRRYIGGGRTDGALRARRVNKLFDFSFFFEILLSTRGEIYRSDGGGPWLWEERNGSRVGNLLLRRLTRFSLQASALRYSLCRTWIDSDWPDLRSRRSRELRG